MLNLVKLFLKTSQESRKCLLWNYCSTLPLDCTCSFNYVLLRLEIPSGMCAKIHTGAASNNRDHALQSLLLLLACGTYIMVLFFTHIPFVMNHTINATPPERLQQYMLVFQRCVLTYFTRTSHGNMWLITGLHMFAEHYLFDKGW